MSPVCRQAVVLGLGQAEVGDPDDPAVSSSRFDGLMSRWTMPRAWAWASPCAAWRPIWATLRKNGWRRPDESTVRDLRAARQHRRGRSDRVRGRARQQLVGRDRPSPWPAVASGSNRSCGVGAGRRGSARVAGESVPSVPRRPLRSDSATWLRSSFRAIDVAVTGASAMVADASRPSARTGLLASAAGSGAAQPP